MGKPDAASAPGGAYAYQARRRDCNVCGLEANARGKGRFRQQTENILWGSNGALPVDRTVPCLPGVFTFPNVSGKERRHQTQKPLELMRQIVRICVPGGCILDPFMGSGTTLLAAELEGYDAIGFELNEAIFRSAQERMKERT